MVHESSRLSEASPTSTGIGLGLLPDDTIAALCTATAPIARLETARAVTYRTAVTWKGPAIRRLLIRV